VDPLERFFFLAAVFFPDPLLRVPLLPADIFGENSPAPEETWLSTWETISQRISPTIPDLAPVVIRPHVDLVVHGVDQDLSAGSTNGG
jgi:hypothetical protein